MIDLAKQMSLPDPQWCAPGLAEPAANGNTGTFQPESTGLATDASADVRSARAAVYDGMYDGVQDAGPEPSIKDKFMEQAYGALGVDKDKFDHMDPEERNKLITRAYARMYASDPDDMKWAGMGSYASGLVGTGMDKTPLAGLIGGPSDELHEALAAGNGAVFEDVFWQHLAFQQGGMAALEKAAAQGQLPKDQLESWRKIQEAADLRKAAEASGDAEAAKRAEDVTWAGNEGLLEHEQKILLQKVVYDGHPEAFKWLSDSSDLDSPIPGGTSFLETVPGGNVADVDQRWTWIHDKMLPEYRKRETENRGAVLDDLHSRETIELPPGGAPE